MTRTFSIVQVPESISDVVPHEEFNKPKPLRIRSYDQVYIRYHTHACHAKDPCILSDPLAVGPISHCTGSATRPTSASARTRMSRGQLRSSFRATRSILVRLGFHKHCGSGALEVTGLTSSATSAIAIRAPRTVAASTRTGSYLPASLRMHACTAQLAFSFWHRDTCALARAI